MMDIIFKMEKSFDNSPNALLPFDSNYNFKGSCCAFGKLSKSNIFIGENNSGKSRFLRSLFAKDFYGIDINNFKKFFSEIKSFVYQSYNIIPETDIEKFNEIYDKIGKEHQVYSNFGNTFFTKLKPFSKLFSKDNKYYFPASYCRYIDKQNRFEYYSAISYILMPSLEILHHTRDQR